MDVLFNLIQNVYRIISLRWSNCSFITIYNFSIFLWVFLIYLIPLGTFVYWTSWGFIRLFNPLKQLFSIFIFLFYMRWWSNQNGILILSLYLHLIHLNYNACLIYFLWNVLYSFLFDWLLWVDMV